MRRLRVGLDVSRTLGEVSGVGAYARALVEGLARVDRDTDYLLYGMFCECQPQDWRRAPVPDAPNVRLHQRWRSTRWMRSRWSRFPLYRDRLLGGVDVLHCTAYDAPLLDHTRLVVTIHDLNHFLFPQFHTRENYDFVTRSVHHAARRADLIVTDSECSRREILRFLHVPPERVEVIHLAAAPLFSEPPESGGVERVRARYGIPGRYFLSVGSLEPRKNLPRTLEAFRAYLDGGGEATLVAAGGSGWKNESIPATVERLGLAERVRFTGYVPQQDLPPLYRGAELFLYPSIYEGFGLPVLEAMACGTPVITGNSSSLPEVAGEAALLVDPSDSAALAAALAALAGNPEMRRDLSARGRLQASRFSWDETARRTAALYRRWPLGTEQERPETAGRGERAPARPPADAHRAEGPILPAAVIAARSVEDLCQTADQFFEGLEENPELLHKPFSNFQETPKALCRLGLLLDGVKLARGMTVVDFGAGSCWLSKILYEMGCETVSVDASRRALAIGQKVFGALSKGREGQGPPAFLPFDGHRIDLPDGSVDRVLCFDAFHHIPNQREVLEEIYRILRADGAAGFCEPGPRHSQSAPAQEDMRRFGVLENDIVVEHIAAMALEIGFDRLYMKAYFDPAPDLSIGEYADLARGASRGEVMGCYVAALEDNRIFFLQKGKTLLDSRGPAGLRASLQTAHGRDLRAVAGVPVEVVVRLANTGTATWVATAPNNRGAVMLAVDIREEATGQVRADAQRVRLPKDVRPGEAAEVTLPLLFHDPGRYHLRLDLVSELVCWFKDVGSEPAEVQVEVSPGGGP